MSSVFIGMACPSLPSLMDGATFDNAAPEEATDLVSDHSKSQAGKKGEKKSNARKKAKDVVTLSSSYTCWRKVPDTLLNHSVLHQRVKCLSLLCVIAAAT